jgi:hypothetical protein
MEAVAEVKKSLKDLRSELKTHRASSMMPVSKLSRASVMAELSKYASPVKHVAVEVEKIAKVKPSPKADKVVEQHIDEAVEQLRKKKPTNSKVKVTEELEIKVPKKVKEVKDEPKTPKPKAEVKPEVKSKKPLTEYQKLWGEARRKGMSPKEASDFAKSKLA